LIQTAVVMKALIVAIYLLLLTNFALAQKSFSDAQQGIATVEVFAFGGIGYAGGISEGEADFQIILAQPQSVALDAFEKLYTVDNPQAKAYALAGIRKLDKGAFKELQASWHGSELTVRTEEGCIVSEESLKMIAGRMNSGKYDAWIK
jgi:hypothetical protein